MPQPTYDTLLSRMKSISLLASAGAVLGWDERTQMPPRGADLRAAQRGEIARLVHQRFTDPSIGDLLGQLETSDPAQDPTSDPAVNVRQWRRDYDRARKLPASLVQTITQTAVLSQQAWTEARRTSTYATFQPWLDKVLDLQRQKAACLGFTTCPYDALLDGYEPGEIVQNLRRVFDELRQPLGDLVAQAQSASHQPTQEPLRRHFPIDRQEALGREVLTRIGFDFDAGRLDVAVHPFCSGIGPRDVRLTTRYNRNFFSDAFFSTLHEAGHGLYEQGLPTEHAGTPRARAVSLGIHESQSRLWENFVGRSAPFWRYALPRVRELFPESLRGVSDQQWYEAVNVVRPSLIRVDSDEATYNLHILLRFELEQALLHEELSTADLPAAWNQQMRELLHIDVPDDAHGCLQDVHWSSGAVGYFATYTLGNLYAAQFFDTARESLGDLDAQLAAGDFAPLLQWLRQNIHQHGQTYLAPDLVGRITGKPLRAQPLLAHLRDKVSRLYRL